MTKYSLNKNFLTILLSVKRIVVSPEYWTLGDLFIGTISNESEISIGDEIKVDPCITNLIPLSEIWKSWTSIIISSPWMVTQLPNISENFINIKWS